MFWRRKTKDFEWHKHVRTTIKLRREDRRRRIDGLKNAAAEGLADAGKAGVKAGVSGLERVGAVMSTPFVWLGSGVTIVATRLLAAGTRLGDMLHEPMLPLARLLQRNEAAPLLAMAAVVAGLLGLGRISVNGWDRVALIELAIAAICVAALILPPLVTGIGPRSLMSALGRIGRMGSGLPRFGALPAMVTRTMGAVAIASVVGLAGWLGLSTVVRLPTPTLASLPGVSREVVKGRASALSGDTLKIASHVLRLTGIDAPEASQLCREIYGRRGRTRSWRYGAAAQRALRDFVRGGSTACELSGSVNGGHKTATCKADGKDVAAELVREGHVFAQAGLFSSYGRLEQDARNAKVGLWRGEAERPEAYRRKLWAVAKRQAPDGCPIKGRVASGKRLYVVPWSPTYRRTKVSEKRGGRWFCSEEEALAAGWQPGDRS